MLFKGEFWFELCFWYIFLGVAVSMIYTDKSIAGQHPKAGHVPWGPLLMILWPVYLGLRWFKSLQFWWYRHKLRKWNNIQREIDMGASCGTSLLREVSYTYRESCRKVDHYLKKCKEMEYEIANRKNS